MKHIIIFLSILFLSTKLFGQEIGVLYLWKTSSGEVWKGFGDKQIHSVYKGQVENGEPNGQGTETSPDGTKYVGEWKDGRKHGQGTNTFDNGDKYEGEWNDGK